MPLSYRRSLRTGAVALGLGLVAIAVLTSRAGDPGDAPVDSAPAAIASTPIAATGTGVTVRALVRQANEEIASLPVTYYGAGAPGGGNQSEVVAQFASTAADLLAIADRVPQANAGGTPTDLDATATALRSEASHVAAIGDCIATDGSPGAEPRFVAAVCGSLAPGHAHH